MTDYVLAIDQGTTSSRAIVFDSDRSIKFASQQEFDQHFPKSGWVEHNPEDIWQSVISTTKNVVKQVLDSENSIGAIGITNQRETTVIWDRESGEPIHRAIVWQDRRTSDTCRRLKEDGLEELFSDKTGLLLDPYFSGTKISWLLDNVEGTRQKAEAGKLAFGTVDTYLIWRLTGGKVHATDATNASRTLCYNISQNCWDMELLEILDIPEAILPDVLDCSADFGSTDAALFGKEIPILGVAGDQQAASIGQACFDPGMVKSTYGTGCFALLNTGSKLVKSQNRLLTTVAYRLEGKPSFALEGSIFIAGAAVQWLRDGLGIINSAEITGDMAKQADDSQDVYLVPAFTGLGAPYWDPEARGAIFGLTRATGPNELARATLESVCYQTRDLIEAMKSDWQSDAGSMALRVDGGMSASDWTMQFLADILDSPVQRPPLLETTALGAAWLAGSKAGIWPGKDEFAKDWKAAARFEPSIEPAERKRKYNGWRKSVERTRSNPGMLDSDT